MAFDAGAGEAGDGWAKAPDEKTREANERRKILFMDTGN